jgi:DNA-binding MarR family transcriptional regulator
MVCDIIYSSYEQENNMVESSVVTKTEYETLAKFRYTLCLFLRFSSAAAKKVGLTPQQYQALLAIKGFPGREQITIGELAERLQIQHHSAVGLVDRLEIEALIRRSPAPKDGRKVLISLTEKGNLVLEELASTHRKELRQLSPRLSALLKRISKP